MNPDDNCHDQFPLQQIFWIPLASICGGVGFFFTRKYFWGRFNDSFPTYAFLLLKKVRSALTHQICSLGHDQSTVAQRTEITVAECFLISCMWALFPNRFPYYACMESIVSPLTCGIKAVRMLICNLPPAPLEEWLKPFSFMCYYCNTGEEWASNKSQHRSELWRRKFSHHSWQQSNSQPFWSQARRTTNWAILTPY